MRAENLHRSRDQLSMEDRPMRCREMTWKYVMDSLVLDQFTRPGSRDNKGAPLYHFQLGIARCWLTERSESELVKCLGYVILVSDGF